MKYHKTNDPLIIYIEEKGVFTKIFLKEDSEESLRNEIKKYIEKQARMRYITNPINKKWNLKDIKELIYN